MDEVKLVGSRSSPYVIRVRIALNIKSVEHELLEEKHGNPKSELLLKSNPVHKKIPVLIHCDKPICESLVILEYIDEVWTSGPSILPLDPNDRAVARFWAAFIDDKWPSSLKEIRMARGEEEKLAATEGLAKILALLEDTFANCSKGKGFFGGDKIGYLDLVAGSFLGWLKVVEKTLNVNLLHQTITPSLLGWAQRFYSHDAVKNVVPDTDELLEILKTYEAMEQTRSPN